MDVYRYRHVIYYLSKDVHFELQAAISITSVRNNGDGQLNTCMQVCLLCLDYESFALGTCPGSSYNVERLRIVKVWEVDIS